MNGKWRAVPVKTFAAGNTAPAAKHSRRSLADSPILRTRDLGLDIGGATIVADVGLEVPSGEFLGIIGPNGAGKTTLFNLLSGLMRPTSGRIELAGRDVTDEPVHKRHAGRARPHVPDLERLSAAARARERQARRGGEPRRGAADLAPRVVAPRGGRTRAAGRSGASGSATGRRSLAGSLPHGDKRKLELAMLLAADKDVILLDEPMAGVSAGDVPGLVDVIRSVHREEGKTVLMVEHHIGVVTGLAERIAVMHHGALLAIDTTAARHGERGGAGGVPRRAAVTAVAAARATVLALDDVHCYLGESHVLQGVSFDVAEGRRHGAARPQRRRQDDDAPRDHGPRPASRDGSSSAARTSGKLPTHRIVRRGVGYVPEDRDVFAGLSVEENLAPRRARRRAALRPRLRPLPRAARARDVSAPARSRAGSSRCSRSRGRC